MGRRESVRDMWNRQEKNRLKNKQAEQKLASGRGAHQRSLESLAEKGRQNRLTQDNASDIAYNAKNQLDVDAIHAEQNRRTYIPTEEEKKKAFMDEYSKLTTPTYDELGAQISPGMRGKEAMEFMKNRERAFAEYGKGRQRNEMQSGQGWATVTGKGARGQGTVGTSFGTNGGEVRGGYTSPLAKRKQDALTLREIEIQNKEMPQKGQGVGGMPNYSLPPQETQQSRGLGVYNQTKKNLVTPEMPGFGAGISSGEADSLFPGETNFVNSKQSMADWRKKMSKLRTKLYNQ